VEYAIALAVLIAVVAFVVSRPLTRNEDGAERSNEAKRAELEAAKEAKYREIRDARLDLEMGKLSHDDHRVVDRELRAEAAEILRELDALEGEKGRDQPLR
jgi:hypothetical protein